MDCRLFGAKPLTEPMLTYVNWNLRNKFRWNAKQNSKLFIHENAHECVVCQSLSRGIWVTDDADEALPTTPDSFISFRRPNQVALTYWSGQMPLHYSDVIMNKMASQSTSLRIVCSTIYSGADQRKHQSCASLAFVQGIHRWPVNSQHNGPETRKMFPFDDVIMNIHRDSATCRLSLGRVSLTPNWTLWRIFWKWLRFSVWLKCHMIIILDTLNQINSVYGITVYLCLKGWVAKF